MAIYVYTGKLGSGKSLCAVGRIQDYLNQNRRVATNIDLNLHKLINYQSKNAVVYRIPDRPVISDLEGLGLGSDEYNEEMNGLIVLDECAQFLNTRNFQDKERKQITSWFVHARKKRWDVIFIIQHLNALDKQFRDLFAEHIVYCNRMDRLKLPFFIRPFALLLGFNGNLPKIHRALVMYGQGQNAMKVDSYVYTGKSLYPAFNTEQGFNSENEGGLYQLLPPYYTYGRNHNGWHQTKASFVDWLSNTRFKIRQFFLIGLMLGVVGTSIANNETFVKPIEQVEILEEIEAIVELDEVEEDHIYITGSLFGSGSKFLYFERNGKTFNPRDEGYKLYVKNKCHARIFKDDVKMDIYCGVARMRQRATATQ